jgi:S-DNA-T family DNA segregation ATPase FtsK/SpoIIIE
MTSRGSKVKSAGEDADQKQAKPGNGWFLAVVERAMLYADDLGAVVLIALALVTTLGLIGLTHGVLVDPWVSILRRWFGLGAFLFPLAMAIGASVLVIRRQGRLIPVHWPRVVAFEICIAAALGLMSVFDGMVLPRAEAGYGGGLVGWGISTLLENLLGAFGRTAVLLVAMLVFGIYALRNTVITIANWLWRLRRAQPRSDAEAPQAESPVAVVVRPKQTTPTSTRPISRLPRAYRKSFKIKEVTEEKPVKPIPRDQRLPPLDLLEEGKIVQVTSKEINQTAGMIEKTLADFGIPARVVDFRSGPAVTQFAVEPGFIEHLGSDGQIRRQKVRVSQISALANDLALTLSAPTLRIEAPVPGRAYVGVEVPNRRPTLVRLRPILGTKNFQSVSSPLAIALGRDVAGSGVVADLAAMPHLLIAGTTGSGKSVCIAAIATCLMANNAPEDMRMVMIDPKMVELLRFNGLPHLYGKVETELDRIIGVLRWCTVEMDRRYRLLEEAKARDIEVYNRRVRRRRDADQLPRIILMIDELADLMMMAPDQTEHTLIRLAQMARATGIHLVLATQRPSTDILTGLIKANFPARISFAVASSVDSRVILDTTGAETLLGQGDMLFLSPEAGSPVRLQGVFVDDREIERLIDYWQEELGEWVQGPAPWEDFLARQAVLDDKDDILEEAIELVKSRGQASASMLQRALRIGYPRAARLMDELEELGVVGRAQTGGRTREVLIGDDEDPLSPGGVDDEDADTT